jgi:hypothetical protein
MPAMIPRMMLAVSGLLFAACGDNTRWAFVSNPDHGGLIVVIHSGGSNPLGLESAALRVDGTDERGEVTALLAHGGDVAVLAHRDDVEVRSPVLPARAVLLPGAHVAPADGPACLRVSVPDSQQLYERAAGPGRLHVAATGTLLVLETGGGPVVFGERAEPEALPPNVLLTATPSNDALALLLPDGRLRVLTPGRAPPPEQRLTQNRMHDSVRLLGPWGEVLAELPSRLIELEPAPGLFLSASITGGVRGAERPATLLMARDNRFLLRVDAP